jgi:hypothetical protein
VSCGRAALALSLALAAACAPEAPGRLPRVVSAAPEGTVEPDRVRVEIAFSAAVDPQGLVDGRWIALGRREDLRDLSRDAEGDGFGPGALVVRARTSLEDGARRLVLVPDAPLPAGGAWVALLSHHARSADGRPVLDAEGRARTFALFFETGPAPDRDPPRARWLVPPHGPAPANLAALRVAFGEPVGGALALGAAASGARAVQPAPDVLGLDLDAPLSPGPLALDVGAVHDAASNAAVAPEPLAVSACALSAPPALAGAAVSIAGELSVRVEATLAGMGRLVLEAQARPGEPACGVAPAAPAVASFDGKVGSCPGYDPCAPAAARCPAAVEARGLCPGTAVRVRIASEDLAGHRSPPGAWIEASALPPRPAPVITEVLADADAPEAGGEYAEVANLGTGPADLAGWAFGKRTASGGFTRCTVSIGEGGPVPPGGHALVVGGAYDARYALPAGVVLYRCGSSAFAGGLANDRAVALALEDPSGAVISSAGIAGPAPRCSAGALERAHPAAADAAASWACPGVRTPGACNASTPLEECPRRPW